MKRQKPARSCAFTIVSKNYLHYARTLMASVAQHAPGLDRVVALCDRADGLDLAREPFEVVALEDLGLPDFQEFVFQYTILEINTAIKPFVFERLFARGYDKVVYLDPDIRVYAGLGGMMKLLESHAIVLTPHLSDHLDDGRHPGELQILQAGSYNLGFLALRRAAGSAKLLAWWQAKMRRDCVVDIPRGLFVDQKWMDLVPGMYEGVYVNRDPGWNVAYWNLNHRRVDRTRDGHAVNGRPLVFFHYSGYTPDSELFSIHQDRYTQRSVGPVVSALARDYAAELKRHGAAACRKLPYAFGAFPDGTPIPNVVRQAFRAARAEFGATGELYSDAGRARIAAFMNEPARESGRSSPHVTRLAWHIHQQRPDLRAAFPDVLGANGERYAHWFLAHAAEQYHLPPDYLAPLHAALAAKSTAAPPLKVPLRRRIYGRLYRLAETCKKRTYRWLDAGTRQRVKRWLFQRAYVESVPASPATATAALAAPGANHPPLKKGEGAQGLNVIGYLHAESGTGEAARSTLRAGLAAGLPLSAIDFRANNFSRMREKLPSRLAQGQRYAINLFHINADQTPNVYKELGAAFFDGHYNIGFWFWELGRFPEKFHDAFRHLDEVWVASTFCQDAVARAAPVPVVRIPLCVEPVVPPRIGRRELKLPADRFLVVTALDALSIMARKNPLGALDAFRRAHRAAGRRPMHLVLKMSNMNFCPDEVRRRIAALTDGLPVTVIEDYLERPRLNALLNVADCYLQLHRSEGFGLPIAEAMYLGKPVVATGWSSNTDFMNLNNSLPVRYRLVELEQDYGPYEKGNVWADPDVEHAAECLVSLARDADFARAIGKRAADDIRRHHSPRVVGEAVRARLAEIGARYRDL